ncbi:MAG TPA: phosphoribosylanthranilate isomerase [Mariprofundaceae bacterium]|nr:phosphoribosylanthranilate isomerase [Mariprofundaceae bacterium]
MMKKSNTRLKICGITRAEDAMSAVQCGADALGFVFYAKSPRFITPQSAQHIISQLPPFVVAVGLFVNASQQEIDTVLQHCSLDVIQLHGDETPAFCAAQSRRAIKAIPIAAADDLNRINDFDCTVLLDTKAPKDVYGGTGTSFDWNMLKNLKHTHPILLAGGIDASNIGQALAIDGIYALDVSSGVESAKGIKDRQKIEQLCGLMNE